MDMLFYLLAAMPIAHAGVVYPIEGDRGSFVDDTGRTCQLETPIKTTIDDLQVGMATELTPGGNASRRVEYRTVFKVFNYIGCVNISSNPSSTNISGIPRVPGLCYSACRTDYVGLSRTMCYCSMSKPSFASAGLCNTECAHPKGTRCGDYKGTYASLYNIASVDDMGENDERLCRLFNDTSRTLQWENCENSHTILCKDENYSVSNTRSGIWFDYTYYCASPKQFRYERFNLTTTESWMATIKSYIFLKCIEGNNPQETLVLLGMPTTSDIISVSTPTPSSQHFIRTSTTSARISVTTPTPSSQHLKIAAYAVLPLLVLLVIGGLICFLVWKRRKRRQAGDNACIKEKTRLQENDVLDDGMRKQFPGKQRSTNTQNDDVPGSRGNHKQVQKQADGHTSADTYDHTGVSVSVKYHVDGLIQNVYDSCEKMPDDTYDHTGLSACVKRHVDVSSTGSVYDSCVKMSDDTYDHTGVSVGLKRHADVPSGGSVYDYCVKMSDDTYDHTGFSVGMKRHTDVSSEGSVYA